MTQALYAHTNNKTIKKNLNKALKLEKKKYVDLEGENINKCEMATCSSICALFPFILLE
jgi:hypothetical protein